jgi:hypothetical protein
MEIDLLLRANIRRRVKVTDPSRRPSLRVMLQQKPQRPKVIVSPYKSSCNAEEVFFRPAV